MPSNKFLKYIRTKERKIILIVIFLFLTFWLTLPVENAKIYKVSQGEIWNEETLYAPFDFPVKKTAEQIEKERKKLLKETPEIFYSVSSLARKQMTDKHEMLWQKILQADSSRRKDYLQAKELLQNIILLPTLDKDKSEILSDFVSLREGVRERLLPKSRVFQISDLVKIYNDAPFDKKGLPSPRSFLQPSYLFDAVLTKQARQQINRFLSSYENIIPKGKIIIKHGERITRKKFQVLRSLNEELMRRNITFSRFFYVGHILIITMILILSYYYLRVNRKRFFANIKNISVVFSTYILILLIAQGLGYLSRFLSPELDINIYWATPVIIATILTTTFYDNRVGFYTNLVVSLLVSIKAYYDFNLFFVFASTGIIATLLLQEIKNRQQFITSLFLLLLAYLLVYMGIELVKGSINTSNLILLVINAFLAFLTYPLMFVYEKLLKVSSVLTFMELHNLEHPLLKKLAREAPGTYQHSLQVANIAELCARELGMNTALIRAGALFHDIGKLENPEVFIENQAPGKNPHDNWAPEESARKIIRHVSYGVELAKEYNLPDEIIRFIQTHHGNSLVKYFFLQKQMENPDAVIYQNDFRYPGPKPETKEEGLLMLVDSVEAAARSLGKPSAEEINMLIEKIFQDRIKDKQLEDTALTFYEMRQIEKILKKTLKEIYHQRPEYPDEKK